MVEKEKKEKKSKNLGGRKTVITPELLEKLERCFARDYTDEEACFFVGIDPKTLYNYCKKEPSFSIKKELLKKSLNMKAKDNLHESVESGDKQDSKWRLERRAKEEYSLRVENINQETDDMDSLYDNDRMKEIKDRIKEQ